MMELTAEIKYVEDDRWKAEGERVKEIQGKLKETETELQIAKSKIEELEKAVDNAAEH